MSDEAHPDPDLTPVTPSQSTIQQRIARWVDLMDACEQFLLVGLRRKVGPDGDVAAAYREWYARQREEHDWSAPYLWAWRQRG